MLNLPILVLLLAAVRECWQANKYFAEALKKVTIKGRVENTQMTLRRGLGNDGDASMFPLQHPFHRHVWKSVFVAWTAAHVPSAHTYTALEGSTFTKTKETPCIHRETHEGGYHSHVHVLVKAQFIKIKRCIQSLKSSIGSELVFLSLHVASEMVQPRLCHSCVLLRNGCIFLT